MLPEEYVELAKCTEPDKQKYQEIRGRLRNAGLLLETLKCLQQVAEAGQRLNTFKRAVFYGKDIELEIDPTVTPPIREMINRSDDDQFIRLLHSGMGLATEAGEFIEALLSYVEGDDLDLVNLGEEIGDVCWYVAIGSDTTEVPLSKIMHANIKKLEKRFGDKFNEKGALIRRLDEERTILDNMNE